MRRLLRKRNGFSLVEVTLALGIAGFCLLAIFGLLPIGLATNQISLEQTAAASYASSLIADLRATPKTTPPSNQSSSYFKIPIPATGKATHTLFLKEDGSSSGALDADADPAQDPHYRATLIFTAPPDYIQMKATMVRVLISWPGMAAPAGATLPGDFAGSFDVVTSLDRN